MRTVLKAARLIDGAGSEPVADAALVVEDGRIVSVGPRESLAPAPAGETEVVETPGGTILPGFIEMHSHIHCSAESDAYRHVTTESDEVLLMRAVQAVRAALISGVILAFVRPPTRTRG